jgi:hypothetical protein
LAPHATNKDLDRVKIAEVKRDRQIMYDNVESEGKLSTAGLLNSKIESKVNNSISKILDN